MSDERRWDPRMRDWRSERDEDFYRDRPRGDRDRGGVDSFADYRDWRAGGERGGWRGGSGQSFGRGADDRSDYGERSAWRGGEDRFGRERYTGGPYGGGGFGSESWRDSRNEGGRGRAEQDWRGYEGEDYRSDYYDRGWSVGRDRGAEQWDRRERERPDEQRRGGWEGERRWADHNRGERNWMEQARDEVASWFGDRDAEMRRDRDRAMQGEHRGRGPGGYRRSDERIREDVHDRLTDDSWLDASGVQVEVQNGEVTLTGLVHDKTDKRRAEGLAERVSGVMHVQNLLRVRAPHGVLHTAGSEQSADAAAGTTVQPSASGPSGGGADSQRTIPGSAATGASTAAGNTASGRT